ncbi:hypothetical protein GCM10025874_30090 [Arenivirga flava]|uniref:Aminotransferase class I/classII large domain-containing protein n=1 Tax=Arenivirga flava TaxID=1930060 RepID=A0AA37UMR2_9MICO|nr:hypothetical protein GCM10025874_30090 [Arenivirga flava]
MLADLLEVRKHLGLLPPAPVQHAMTVALRDDEHVAEQRRVYASRRAVLEPALREAGFRIDRSEAGLYLWATKDDDAWTTLAELAELGILAAPGTFYGEGSGRHVRVALTASDERIAAAAARLRRKADSPLPGVTPRLVERSSTGSHEPPVRCRMRVHHTPEEAK